MRKEDYIKRYGEAAWEHHLIVSREWIKKNKQKTVNSVDNKKEYLHQYNQIRWRKQHG